MNPATPIQKVLTGAAAVLLAVFLVAGTALAIDRPPQSSQQQRVWLVGHLVTDMEALGTFDGNSLAKVPGIVKALTDDQVALLAQYYFLTRSKTEQDASIYAMQQQGDTDEQVNAAKAAIADLLTTMNDQIEACYADFSPMPEPVQYVADICYASVPGWCCDSGCYVPEWYYDNGCFVGPGFNAACSGPWATAVCNAYYNHGSRFYAAYHKVGKRFHVRRSVNLAQRHAKWFRYHGDWRKLLAHDRLLHRSRQSLLTRVPGKQLGNRVVAVHKPHSAAAHTRPQHTGNLKPVVHNRKPKIGSRKAIGHRPKIQAAKPRAKRASIPHRHAPRHGPHAARHAAHAPRPAAHASHPRPAAHAAAHARSGGHSKHR
jgi:hypothetical protein